MPHLPQELGEIHQHEWRQSGDTVPVGADSGTRPAHVVHLLANVVLREGVQAQLLNKLHDVRLGAKMMKEKMSVLRNLQLVEK